MNGIARKPPAGLLLWRGLLMLTASAGGDEFLQYVQEQTDWSQGFPDPDDCE